MADDKMDVNALRPLTLDEQAERLQRKGLQFSSKERVKKYLQNVGYCRLKGYFPSFEDPHHRFFEEGEGRFKPDVSFDDVLDLYIFDRKLRLILLEAFERIEVALRSLWQNEMSRRYGPFVHKGGSDQFVSDGEQNKKVAKKTGGTRAWTLDRMQGRLGNSKSGTLSPSTQELIQRPSVRCHPDDLPIWVLVEELTFDALLNLIQDTKDENVKKHIACALGIRPTGVFREVLDALKQIRNVCAHHHVLWDREFRCDALALLRDVDLRTGDKPKREGQPSPWVDEHLHNHLVIIAHIVRVLSPQTSWCNRLVNHLRTATPDQRGRMGFPKGPWHAALERDPHSVR